VPEVVVDEAVRRVLRLKLGVGLFERPYADESLAAQVTLRQEDRQLALQVAQESMVLLKNEGNLLPLSPGKEHLALIGPLVAARRDLLGTWTLAGRGCGIGAGGDTGPFGQRGRSISYAGLHPDK
jgi:beta-glucosidase